MNRFIDMPSELIGVIVFLGIVAAFLAVIIPLLVVNNKYKKFVVEHSAALKELAEINNRYNFNIIKRGNFEHSYDNRNFYDTISEQDYLIYQLVYKQKEILKPLNDAYGNKIMFEKYKEETKKCHMESFDTSDLPTDKERLYKIERDLFCKGLKDPALSYSARVHLKQTNINGRPQRSKSRTFSSKEIRSLIERVNDRNNGFYRDQEIWNSICRVERGKVTNKIRFAIYDRDGWRCQKCGRSTRDLEIDHIYPISKGGKSVPENLQTLCKACNKAKGSNVGGSSYKYKRY